MLPWWSHTHIHTRRHLQPVNGMWKNCTYPFNQTRFSGSEVKYFYFKMNSKQPYFIHPTSCCSIFISFWFSTVHLTGFPIHMWKLLIIYHSSHKPDVCSSLKKLTCSHKKMSSWIKDICRMKLLYYSPVNKNDQFKTTAKSNYTTQL